MKISRTVTIETDGKAPGLFGQSYRVHMDKLTGSAADVSGCALLVQRLTRGPLSADQAMELQSLGAAMEALTGDILGALEALNNSLHK